MLCPRIVRATPETVVATTHSSASIIMALFAAFTRRAASSARLLPRTTSAAACAPLSALLPWPLNMRSFASAQPKWGVMNDSIKARVVQLVDDDGKVNANVPISRALAEARKRNVDLVQVSANGEKVVCRMFDAKKRLFSMKKAAKPQKPKQDKEVVFGVKIEVRLLILWLPMSYVCVAGI